MQINLEPKEAERGLTARRKPAAGAGVAQRRGGSSSRTQGRVAGAGGRLGQGKGGEAGEKHPEM